MEQWQFLIQKQGERVWLPLESPTQEIIEGRYRIVARSSRINTDVEMRIIHISASESPRESPPMRRVHKRSRRTNHEGLVAVMPFTYFQSGLWEICCSGNLIADMMGKPWQYSIAFKVKAKVADNHNQEEGDRQENLQAESASLPSQEESRVTSNVPALQTPPPPPPPGKLRSPTHAEQEQSEKIANLDHHRHVADKDGAENGELPISTTNQLSQPPATPSVNNLQQSQLNLTPSPSTEVETEENLTEFNEPPEPPEENDAIIDALLSLYEIPDIEFDGADISDARGETADREEILDDEPETNEPAIQETANVSVDESLCNHIIAAESEDIGSEIARENQDTREFKVGDSFADGLEIESEEASTVRDLPEVAGLIENQEAESPVETAVSRDLQTNSVSFAQESENLEQFPSIGDGEIFQVDGNQTNPADNLDTENNQSLQTSEDVEAVVPINTWNNRELSQQQSNRISHTHHNNIDDDLGADIGYSHKLENSSADWEQEAENNQVTINTDTVSDQPEVLPEENHPQTDIELDGVPCGLEFDDIGGDDGTIATNYQPDNGNRELNSPEITPITVADDDLPVAIVLRNVDTLSNTSDRKDRIGQQTPSSNWLQGDSAEDILQSLLDLALPDTEPLLAAETMPKEAEALELSLPLAINLEAQTYISRWGVPLTIAGNVEINLRNGQTNTSKYYYQHVSDVKVRLDVRSPQQLEVLASVEEPLGAEEIVPFPARVTCQIPGDCESKLLLGDIYIYGILDGVGESTLLASQSFTIAADLNSLLAISAAAKPSAPDMDYPILAQSPPPPPPSQNTSSIDLELFNLVKTTKIGETANINHFQVKRSPKVTLPPTIKSKDSPPDKRVEIDAMETPTNGESGESSTFELSLVSSLPFLRKISLDSSTEISEIQANIDAIVNRSFPDSDVTTDTWESDGSETADRVTNADISVDGVSQQAKPGENSLDEDLLSSVHKLEGSEEFTALEPLGIETETIENEDNAQIISTPFTEIEPNPTQIVLPSPQQPVDGMSPLLRKWAASQNDGNISDRNLLLSFDATSADSNDDDSGLFEESGNITANRGGEIFISGSRVKESIPTPIPPSPPLVYSSLQQQPPRPWIAKEIIVEDDEVFEPHPGKINHLSQSDYQVEELETELTGNLSIPILHLLPGDLIAGSVVRVRVELPQTLPQMAVKVWMEDCQTRTLLEGPHLLPTLLPNNKGGMETIAEINVPFGSIQVQIGAIAIHLTSQRESHKASLQRRVIPPDLPKLEINQLYGI